MVSAVSVTALAPQKGLGFILGAISLQNPLEQGDDRHFERDRPHYKPAAIAYLHRPSDRDYRFHPLAG